MAEAVDLSEHESREAAYNNKSVTDFSEDESVVNLGGHLSEEESEEDLDSPPCPNAPYPYSPSPVVLFDPLNVPDHRLCSRPTCKFCPAAGCLWTDHGLHCFPGRWKKKPRPDKGPTLEPHIWSKLPPELLESIFARLPSDGIARTRALSRAWNVALSSSSTATKECGKVQRDLCAFLGFDAVTKACWVNAYDEEASKWYLYSVESIPECYASAVVACDGGLVCFVPRGEDVAVQPILVCNPLTREWRQLPLKQFALSKAPRIVQLRLDRKSGFYTVIVVGDNLEHGCVAEVYCSERKQWSKLQSGELMKEGAAREMVEVYDCCTGGLTHHIVDVSDGFRGGTSGEDGGLNWLAGEWEVAGVAVHTKDLYVLYFCEGEGSTMYSVSKYVGGNFELGSHGLRRCARATEETFEFEMVNELKDQLSEGFYVMGLMVCNNFVLAFGEEADEPDVFYLRLYNMKTGNWTFRNFFTVTCHGQLQSILSADTPIAFCELRWDACP